MVQYRDGETGELTTKIVDKVIKKRMSSLKKAIMKKRESDKLVRAQRKEARREAREALLKINEIQEESCTETDGYITIAEEDLDPVSNSFHTRNRKKPTNLAKT